MTEEQMRQRHEAEMAQIYASIDQMRQTVSESRATVEQMAAQNQKFAAETSKIGVERLLYPVVVAAGLMGTGAAFAKLFL